MYVCVLDACFIDYSSYYYSSISDAMNRAKANRDRATEKFARVLWLNAKNFEQHLNWPQGMGKNTPSAEYYVPWFKRWLDNLG